MPRYDFKCPCGETFEALVPSYVTQVPCNVCSPAHVFQPELRINNGSQMAQRLLSAPARIHIH